MSITVSPAVSPSSSAPRPPWNPAQALTAALGGQPVVAGIVAALLVLGMAARLRQYLGRPSYWYDEAYVLLAVFDRPWPTPGWSPMLPPAFLHLLRELYRLAGPSELAMRAPAALASLLSVFLMIPLARRLAGAPGWPWAVALCAISFHGVTHAYEVKPYAGDLLVTQLVLLAALPAMGADTRPLGAAAFAVAVLAPWWSSPSVFVLGGVSLALLVQATRTGAGWSAWVAFSTAVLGSVAILWALTIRGVEHEALLQHFAACFPDDASIAAAPLWLAQRIVHIGHYGTTGMGVPLLVLATLGLVARARQSGAQAALLAGPIALALLTSAWHPYPLCDRLIFFAVPCIWLAAAAGIGVLTAHLQPRWTWVVPVLLAALLLPGVARLARSLVRVEPRAAYRDAFEYVHERWRPGDTLWVVTPEVFAVYFANNATVLGPATPAPVVQDAARRGRLWIIDAPAGPGRPSIHAAYTDLPAAVDYRAVKGLEIFLLAGVEPGR